MPRLIDKSALVAEIEKRRNKNARNKLNLAASFEDNYLLSFINTLEAKKIPNWKKTMHDNGCWSCEIGVNPSKRLYKYGRYTIDADELFKLLDKEE